jgi:hypothetical protein
MFETLQTPSDGRRRSNGERGVHTPTSDPTKTTYGTLQAAWRHFNKRLFDNRLPPCLVTLQRRANVLGYFAHASRRSGF